MNNKCASTSNRHHATTAPQQRRSRDGEDFDRDDNDRGIDNDGDWCII